MSELVKYIFFYFSHDNQTQIQLREREMELNHYRSKLAIRYSHPVQKTSDQQSDVNNTEESKTDNEHIRYDSQYTIPSGQNC